MKARVLSLAVLMAVALAACGGNDDTPSTSGNLNSYAGTWKNTCNTSDVTDSSGANMKELEEQEFASSGNNLTVKFTISLYQGSDTSCSGTPATAHVQNGTITYKNNAALKFNGIDVTGHEVSIAIAAIGGLASGSTVGLPGLIYPEDYFTKAINIPKAYLYLKDNQIYSSNGSTTLITELPYLTRVQ